ncbi:MAG TPA: right-handed parallel beta-helix repeat-containing protein [bacterium]|nr:right-handed parallel beta-helix repeat-containing protein [bacterium]
MAKVRISFLGKGGAFCALLVLAACVQAHDYFVAPSGMDSNPGTLDQPFRTLAWAVPYVRAGDTLYLRAGVYRQAVSVEHGGTASAPAVFSAYGAEAAVLAGSDPLVGTWKKYDGKIWCLDGVSRTSDLFVDGQEMSIARWPTAGPGAPMDQGWALTGAGTNAAVVADPHLPDLPLVGARVHIVPGLAWVSFTRSIKEYGRGRLTLSSPVCGATPAYCPRPGNRYFLYGSLALLGGPGEWYQDPATLRIYLWAPDGRDPADHLVEVARRKAVIRDDGYSHVEFRNLHTFSGGIKISRCVGCRVIGVDQRYVQRYTEVEGYSAENPTNSLYAGSDCEWADGSIEGSSGDGLAVSGTHQHVHDMLIHDVCREASYSGALALLGSGQVIENNTLYDSGRYLINLGTTHGGRIAHNDLYNSGLLTNDSGAIYSYDTDGAGMVIAFNDVHHAPGTRGVGIYLDNGDSDYVVLHNLVHDCAWAGVELNLPSNCNVVCNNTLWNCKHWVWADGNIHYHSMTGTVLANNVVNGTELLVRDRLAPVQVRNAALLQPPQLFAPGGFSLAAGSWAIASGVSIPPYTDGGCGAAPDLGAINYGCGQDWSAGCARRPAAFPYPALEMLGMGPSPGPDPRTEHPSAGGAAPWN